MKFYAEDVSLVCTSAGRDSNRPFAYPAILDSSTFAVRSCFVLSVLSALLYVVEFIIPYSTRASHVYLQEHCKY